MQLTNLNLDIVNYRFLIGFDKASHKAFRRTTLEDDS